MNSFFPLKRKIVDSLLENIEMQTSNNEEFLNCLDEDVINAINKESIFIPTRLEDVDDIASSIHQDFLKKFAQSDDFFYVIRNLLLKTLSHT